MVRVHRRSLSGLVSRGTVSRPPRGGSAPPGRHRSQARGQPLRPRARGPRRPPRRAARGPARSQHRRGHVRAVRRRAWPGAPARPAQPDRQARGVAGGGKATMATPLRTRRPRFTGPRPAGAPSGGRRRAIRSHGRSVSAGRAAGAAVAAPAAAGYSVGGAGARSAKWKSSAMRSTDFRWPASSASQVRVEMRPYMTSRRPLAPYWARVLAPSPKTTTSR